MPENPVVPSVRKLLKTAPTAQLVGVTPDTLRAWPRNRPGFPQPYRTPGNHLLWDPDEVLAFLASNANAGEGGAHAL